MPAQAVDDPRALGDQVGAVVEEEADVHRLLVQIRDRELLDPVLDDRAAHGERVDLIGLAGLAFALARGAHAMRRDPDYPLAGRQESLLQAP